MKINRLIFVASLLMCASVVFADAPVVNGYTDDQTQEATTSAANGPATTDAINNPTLTIDQRVSILERQVNNLTQVIAQMNNLQQQVASLQGRVDEQRHNLDVLQNQVRNQYQDLDQRVGKPQTTQASPDNANTAGDQTVDQSSQSVSKPTKQSTTPLATTNNANNINSADQKAYQTAFTLLKNKKYPSAAQAFKNLIKQYPTSSYVPSSYYWLGQLYLLQGQPDKAIVQFRTILKKYSKDNKVPDTMTQLGLAYYANGDLPTAKAQLLLVQKKYPGTNAATLAKKRLQQIQGSTNNTAMNNDTSS